jgi:signal transduction histidine kinase
LLASLIAIAASAAGAAGAAATPLPLSAAPFAYWLNALVATGGVALGIGVVVWVFWRRAHETPLIAAWRHKAAGLEEEARNLELLLLTAPEITLRWRKQSAVPDSGPFGEPELLGQGGQLAELLGRRRYRSGAKLLAAIKDALTPEEAQAFEAAIAALLQRGEPFTMRLALGEAGGFIAEGRALGAESALWLKEIAPERQEINRLKRELSAVEHELALFLELLDRMSWPVWRRGGDLKLTWVNSAYAQAVEAASVDAAVEASIELDRGEAALVRGVADRKEQAHERKYVVIGGKRRSLDITELPLSEGLAGFALDATAEDNALHEMMSHVKAHADTLNKLATAVAIFGPDQRLRFFNQAYARLWNLDEDWLEQRPPDGEILDRLRETRRLPEQSDYQGWKRQRLHKYSEIGELPEEVWHLPDGRTLRMVAQTHPFGGLLYLFEDVSSLVALESSLNRLIGVQRGTLDNLYEGVALFGSDGRLKLHNPAFVRIWHLAARNLDSGPHFDQVASWCSILFGDLDDWRALKQNITEITGERRSVEGRQVRADGSVVQYAVIPLADGGTLLSFFDITDTTRIERALRERNEALETADRLKSEFVGHVSYHLRTPLNTIQGFGEILEREMFGGLNLKQHEYTAAILQASEQLMALINDILDLATIEAGAMALELTDLDIHGALQGAVNLTTKKALDAGLTLKLDCPPEIGRIRADDRRIKQVVFNLLSNAIAFTPEGGAISVGADRSAGHVRIWVSDTGEGIAPQRQASVFERFESHGGQGRRGAGLGLSLVKSFIELHGGWVALESVEGQGTVVICHLPDRAVLSRDAAE